MRRFRRLRRRIDFYIGLVFDELRDAWAIAAAEVTGLLAFVNGAPLVVAGISAGSVLGVRVAAGLALPRDEQAEAEPLLTADEVDVAQLICDDYTTAGIARALKTSTDEIRELQASVYEVVGSDKPSVIREWLRQNKFRPKRPSIWSQMYNSDIVRVTLAISGLFTFYQRLACPLLLHPILPGLQCP
jgi:hypothetical protein